MFCTLIFAVLLQK